MFICLRDWILGSSWAFLCMIYLTALVKNMEDHLYYKFAENGDDCVELQLGLTHQRW